MLDINTSFDTFLCSIIATQDSCETSAEITPVILSRAFFTLPEQPSQVIPPISIDSDSIM